MYRFKNSLIGLIGLLTLMVITTVTVPHVGRGAIGNGSNGPTSQTQNVNVVNTPAVNAQQSGTWNVGINGTPTVGFNSSANTVKIDPVTTLAIRDADNAARQPFHAAANANILDGTTVANVNLDVPAGKRAVIEYVSVTTLIYPQQRPLVMIAAKVGDDFSQTYLPSAFQFNQSSYDWWVASQQVRLYADGGVGTIQMVIARDTNGGIGVVYTSVSGYLIDMP